MVLVFIDYLYINKTQTSCTFAWLLNPKQFSQFYINSKHLKKFGKNSKNIAKNFLKNKKIYEKCDFDKK